MASPIRYARLGYVALQVTDVAASRDFYEKLVGLQLARETADAAYLRCSAKPFDVALHKGDQPGLLRVGFEVQSVADLKTAFDHLFARGYAPAWLDAAQKETLQAEDGFRVRNPDIGLEVELYAGQTQLAAPYEPTVAQIARLGHVVMNVKSYAAAHKFWVEDMGFLISDHVPGKIAFLRCPPNPLHHSLALLEGPNDSLNHVNFMVTDIDDIGCGMNRMKKAGAPIVFGPGRHLPSTSIFLYFLDPDGMTAEYSFGMEEFEAEGARAPRELQPKPEVLDTWGSLPDPRFGKTGVIVHA